jgi:peptidoglycan hydrolase-like amidase
MNITNRRRFRRSLALALTFIVSSCALLTPLAGINALAAPRRPQQIFQGADDAVDSPNEIDSYASAEGPIVRVALMTDVSSISISCASGLVIKRSGEEVRAEKTSLSALRVELRRQSAPDAPLPSSAARYAVFVGSSSEARNARKIEDRLKLEFSEPVTTAFDEKFGQYVVTIGRFTTQEDAEEMANRLREAGYKAPRVVPGSRATKARETSEPELINDTYARAAKYKAEPGVSGRPDSSSRGKAHMVAIVADKTVASSEREFVVSAGDEPARVQSMKSAMTSTAPSLRIGSKEYRGTIRFILNPRGRINVVNFLPLEQYLRGVVPLEMSGSAYADIEAVKAQAVASRSFALASLGHHRDEGYDLVDDSRAQVYGGLSAERELTNRAIEQTRGLVAAFPNEAGKLEPIQALYTTNCGGRTENNDEVFGGKALPYLRSVACVTDRQSLAGRDIVTTKAVEPPNGNEGRSLTREVALLNVLGFSLPRRASSHYLRGTPDQDEVRSWTDQLARLTQRDKPASSRAEVTRLAEFARLVAASVYGEGRANKLLTSVDADYLLAGLRVEQLSRERRADVAMLLKDGILRLPDDGPVDGRATITRAQAIETIGHAILLRSASDTRFQISNLKFEIRDFRSGTAAPAEKGRLIIARPNAPLNATRAAQGPSFVSVNTSSSGMLARAQAPSSSGRSTRVEQDDWRQSTQVNGQAFGPNIAMDIAEGAWLFRAVGGESYAVDRLTLIGGERVAYHLNAAGRVDFLEASISERGASIDVAANVAPWQERVSIEELQQRLSSAHINVGRPERIEPTVFSASTRITEVELSGNDGHARLHIPQIRGALGLKEHLFAIDRETDARGRLIAFVFTGRGSGHGVGMCQAGAYRMAKEGYSYTAILQKYYTGIEIQKEY